MSHNRLAVILSSTALVVAIFGATPLGQAALDAIPRNSVGTNELRANAVTSAKVKDRTLRRVDFAAGVIPTGAAGVKGDAGPKGDKGDAGPRTPTWGEAVGPGFGGDFSTWKEIGSKVTLVRTPGGRYFVFGRYNVEINCGASVCSQTYGLFVNGLFVPQTNVTVSGPANSRTRANVSVFGVGSVGSRLVPAAGPALGVRYSTFGPLTTASIGASVGAIALG